MSYSGLFSQFGYQALDLIFKIDVSGLRESELKQLSSLAANMELNHSLHAQLTHIINTPEDTPEKIQRLLSFTDAIDHNNE